MKRRQPVNVEAVHDTGGLTEPYKRAVAAALPRGVDAPEEFWRDLETAVAIFFVLQQRRADMPPKRERMRWQRIEKLTDALAREVRAIKPMVLWSHDDPLWPNRGLRALWDLKYRAETSRIGYEMLSAAHKGRRNPHRAHLYAAICDLWTIHLGQELRYSMQGGVPSGPLIRFFTACIKPVLGAEAPTAHTIASVIDREKHRVLTRGK